jgi:hypothetical protein
MNEYSFKKGVIKGLISLLSITGFIVAFSGFADFTLWQLLETYIKPVLGGLSVGAAITIAVNYLKFKFLS